MFQVSSFMFQVLGFFWFLRTTKIALFYLYLWQLKEYHIGRFSDHFRTEKGRRLFLNKLIALKVILALFLLFGLSLFPPFDFYIFPFSAARFNLSILFEFFVAIPILVLILYIIESAWAFKNLFQKRLKKPVLTQKTILLILAILGLEVLFLFFLFLYARGKPKEAGVIWFTFFLLISDILAPIIVSIIVLCFQPLVVLAKNQIIKKARKARERFENLLVIGITGSYGKTSTKEFLTEILSERFNVLKTEAHQNSEMGVSQCILNNLKKEHEVFVCEMAAYERGAIKFLCDITRPQIGILTGINEQHQSLFGSQENIVKTKYELIESLPEKGIAVFNGNNSYCVELYKKTQKIQKRIVSSQPDQSLDWDLKAEEIEIKKASIFFKVIQKDDKEVGFELNLLGKQNIENVLMAAQAARELGMSLEEISGACKKIKPQEKTMELKKGKNGLFIIDDSYAANPQGVISALDYLKVYSGKKIIIMPCLIELGKASKRVHTKIGEKIGEVCDLAVIITKDKFKEIKKGAMSSGMKGENVLFLEKPGQVFEELKPYFRSENVVLLEGRVPQKLINLLFK